MSIFFDIVKYLPILSKANWYYLGIAWYTSQLQNIVRWCKLQIQYFISLYILGCPEILVDIFRRGSSSITRMYICLVHKRVWKYLDADNIDKCLVQTWTEVRFCSMLTPYCPILYDIGQIRLISPDIAIYSLMLKGKF